MYYIYSRIGSTLKYRGAGGECQNVKVGTSSAKIKGLHVIQLGSPMAQYRAVVLSSTWTLFSLTKLEAPVCAERRYSSDLLRWYCYIILSSVIRPLSSRALSILNVSFLVSYPNGDQCLFFVTKTLDKLLCRYIAHSLTVSFMSPIIVRSRKITGRARYLTLKRQMMLAAIGQGCFAACCRILVLLKYYDRVISRAFKTKPSSSSRVP